MQRTGLFCYFRVLIFPARNIVWNGRESRGPATSTTRVRSRLKGGFARRCFDISNGRPPNLLPPGTTLPPGIRNLALEVHLTVADLTTNFCGRNQMSESFSGWRAFPPTNCGTSPLGGAMNRLCAHSMQAGAARCGRRSASRLPTSARAIPPWIGTRRE